jgi:hypothetical protein
MSGALLRDAKLLDPDERSLLTSSRCGIGQGENRMNVHLDMGSAFWLAVGVAIGVAIGVGMGNVAEGIGVGIAIGIALMLAQSTSKHSSDSGENDK